MKVGKYTLVDVTAQVYALRQVRDEMIAELKEVQGELEIYKRLERKAPEYLKRNERNLKQQIAEVKTRLRRLDDHHAMFYEQQFIKVAKKLLPRDTYEAIVEQTLRNLEKLGQKG